MSEMSKEAMTDLWVAKLLERAGIKADAQGSSIKEVSDALKSASKKGSGNAGFPEYVACVKDFLIVIEDKASLLQHEKKNIEGCLEESVDANVNYAVNGAVFYGKHLCQNTHYKKVIAIGISGDEKRHRISPYYIEENGKYTALSELETLASFSEENIEEYYIKEVLHEKTDWQKTTEEIIKDARSLHEDLRNYGSIQDMDKPLIVSGILLALRETQFHSFSIESLSGDENKTDGQKILDAIKANLDRANVSPEVKKEKILTQFKIIAENVKINQIHPTLGMSPLKHFTLFLYEKIYNAIRFNSSTEDFLGRFYGEFMSYSGGDGQSLGIILTPSHITELFCELAELKVDDKVFDPCCGTAGFLVASMHKMLSLTDDVQKRAEIKKNQLFGIEMQRYMFTIATTNMIVRGDGKSNLEMKDFLKEDAFELQKKGYTVAMMNPPYSQGSAKDPDLYELAFTEHLLNSVAPDARVLVILPQSAMTGKSKEEAIIKAELLKHHTLEGVITLNKNTFYGVGTNPCIAIFTARVPHPKSKLTRFINFEDDGFEVSKHIGLIDTGKASDRRAYLLDVWRGKRQAPTNFCVKAEVEASDEWLHSFYYFNDELPTSDEFSETIADYLTFEVNMITHGKGYLFGAEESGNFGGNAGAKEEDT